MDFVETWYREEQQPFTGWDFSYLSGRMAEERPPWSYADRAAALLDRATAALDVGTGGGERFLALRDHWPTRVTETEEYPPNLALVRERLEPLGVRVVDACLTDVDPLPFASGEFDLVLNRHSAFNSAEVGRVLAAGGTFLTRQVHGRWARTCWRSSVQRLSGLTRRQKSTYRGCTPPAWTWLMCVSGRAGSCLAMSARSSTTSKPFPGWGRASLWRPTSASCGVSRRGLKHVVSSPSRRGHT